MLQFCILLVHSNIQLASYEQCVLCSALKNFNNTALISNQNAALNFPIRWSIVHLVIDGLIVFRLVHPSWSRTTILYVTRKCFRVLPASSHPMYRYIREEKTLATSLQLPIGEFTEFKSINKFNKLHQVVWIYCSLLISIKVQATRWVGWSSNKGVILVSGSLGQTPQESLGKSIFCTEHRAGKKCTIRCQTSCKLPINIFVLF